MAIADRRSRSRPPLVVARRSSAVGACMSLETYDECGGAVLNALPRIGCGACVVVLGEEADDAVGGIASRVVP